MLSSGLGDGLLSAEDERWTCSAASWRRFSHRKTMSGLHPGDDGGSQRSEPRAGAPGAAHHQVDIAAEASRVTLDVLVRTIFSDGLGCDAEELRAAIGEYFKTIGQIDPLDLMGVPASVPRLSHLRVRSTLRFFELRSTRSSPRGDGGSRQNRRCRQRYPYAVAQRARSGNRPAHDRGRGALQHPHLHRRGPRDDGEHHDLVAVPAVAIGRMVRAGRSGSAARARRPDRRPRRPAGRDPRRHRRGDPALSADRRDQPRGHGAGRARRRKGQARHDGGDRALCAAPP